MDTLYIYVNFGHYGELEIMIYFKTLTQLYIFLLIKLIFHAQTAILKNLMFNFMYVTSVWSLFQITQIYSAPSKKTQQPLQTYILKLDLFHILKSLENYNMQMKCRQCICNYE
jgi:hypothetical protein